MIVHQVLFSMCCLILAGAAKALLDNSAEGRFHRPWLNKAESYKRKWKLDVTGDLIPYTGKRLWYHLWLFTPACVERYPLASTVGVFLTDGWHFFQMLMLFFLTLAPAAPVIPNWWHVVIVAICGGLVLKGYFVITRRFFLKTKV